MKSLLFYRTQTDKGMCLKKEKKPKLRSRKPLIAQSATQEHKVKSIATTQAGKSIHYSSQITQRHVSAEISLWCEWISVFKADPCTHAHTSVWPMATELATLSG